MLARVDEVTVDHRLAEGPAGFETMQALNEHEPGTVLPHQDRRFLPHFEHVGGKFLHRGWIESLAPLHRHVNVVDGEFLYFEHALPRGKLTRECERSGEKLSLGRNAPQRDR